MRGGALTAESYRTNGFVVLPGFAPDVVYAVRQKYMQALHALPEVRRDAVQFEPSPNAYGEIGIMSAYTHPFIKRLREIVFVYTMPFFEQYLQLLGPRFLVEQLMGFLILRPPRTTLAEPPLTRDSRARTLSAQDMELKGWLNLDLQPQVVKIVPGSHNARDYNARDGSARTVTIPPGHIFIYSASALKAEVFTPSADPSAQVQFTWRITQQATPLYESVTKQLAATVPPIVPPAAKAMLSSAGPDAWQQFQAWSQQNFNPAVLVSVKAPDGRTYTVVPDTLPSPVPPFTPLEMQLFRPRRIDAATRDTLGRQFTDAWNAALGPVAYQVPSSVSFDVDDPGAPRPRRPGLQDLPLLNPYAPMPDLRGVSATTPDRITFELPPPAPPARRGRGRPRTAAPPPPKRTRADTEGARALLGLALPTQPARAKDLLAASAALDLMELARQT
jgi:hypothetical protein